jgi:hypothetical protein
MISVNDKGANEHRVTLIKRGKGRLHRTMLKDVLIHKSENYHLHCGRFITNNIPGLLHREKNGNFGNILCRIMPRYDELDAIQENFHEFGYDTTTSDGLFLHKRHAFKPSTVYSTAGLCERFAQYISEYNFFLYMVGANHSLSADDWNFIPSQDEFDDNEVYDLRNNIDPETVVKYISVGFESDGKMILTLSSQFASNFFIQLDPVFAKQIGFPELLYIIDDLGVITASNQAGVDPLYNLETNLFTSDADIHEGRIFISTGSIFGIDDRYSIDLEVTLPLAQTIDVLNGKERHTFLLSRFNITDYKKIKCRTVQKQGVILTRGVFDDYLSLGISNLVTTPTAHTAQLMNGPIQEMNVRLLLRYKKFIISSGVFSFTIEHKQIELDDTGLYDILLQFNKNV